MTTDDISTEIQEEQLENLAENPAEDQAVESKKEVVDNKSLELDNEQFTKLKLIIEAILMASDSAITVKTIVDILEQHNNDIHTKVKDKQLYNNKYILLALDELACDFENRAIELKNLNQYYRIQTKPDYADFVQSIWQEKPSKYSKATLETLAIIAYRQPITRGEIEHIRGVAVSSQIIRNLAEREWIKVVGHREVPGRPAIYATTQTFLHDLNIGKLEDLPALADIKDIKDALNLDSDDQQIEEPSQESKIKLPEEIPEEILE